MAKNTFLDWDTTANNNTDVGGISIAENCPPSNINNGMRETMAQLRAGVDGKVVYAVKVANYTALAADNNAVHRYTATATVTLTAAATLAANWHYTVIADGADVTIDPNGAETIDGAATLVVPNGSSAHIICNGSAFFTEKTIAPLQPFGTVASAGTTDIGAVTSQNVTVTGTTTITAFGTVAAGTFRRLVFSGILTLTHNATSLILPQGGNVVTAVGDSLEAVSLGSGNWRVTSYQVAIPLVAEVLLSSQTVSAAASINFTGFLSSTYDYYMLVFVDTFPATNATQICVRFGAAGTYNTGANYYYAGDTINSSGTRAAVAAALSTRIAVTDAVSNNAALGVAGRIEIYKPSSTTTPKRVTYQAQYSDGTVWQSGQGGGTLSGVLTAITDIQLLSSSGNITGTAYLYGHRKS
jgi:hypothetical protein